MYIAFLRSINVGGRNIIRMKELVAEMLSAGFTDVQTYIQSGNVIFNYGDTDCEIVSNLIEELINKKFNLNISAIVLKRENLNQIIDLNPYKVESNKEVFVTLSKKMQLVNDLNEIKNDFGDCYLIANNVFYIKCLNGYSNTKFNNAFFEKRFKVIATTRNIETLMKVRSL